MRVHALLALELFQNESSVVVELLRLLQTDPSPEVRRTALHVTAVTDQTLPGERLWDIYVEERRKKQEVNEGGRGEGRGGSVGAWRDGRGEKGKDLVCLGGYFLPFFGFFPHVYLYI